MTKWLLKSNSTSTRIKNTPCDTNDGHDKGPGAVWLGTGGMEQVWNRYGTGMEQDGSTIQIRNFELSPAVPYLFHTPGTRPAQNNWSREPGRDEHWGHICSMSYKHGQISIALITTFTRLTQGLYKAYTRLVQSLHNDYTKLIV